MAIRSGFFNSINGDRKYGAERFAEYFASFIGNGVFPNPGNGLQVMANNDMTVTVKAGKAWINGYILINDDDYILTLDPADGALNRIDRIVARYDTVDREIRLEVKKGTFASSPVAPTLQRDADAYELGLADVYIAAGVVSVTQANITDLRFNTELCGIVHGTVEQVDTTTLFNQYVDWYTTTTGQAETDIEAIKQQFQNNLTQFEQDWNDWFSQQQTEGFIMAVEKGQPNGIATLDENGKVPNEQLPELTAEDVGAETPTGAQAKADAALAAAKQYTDQEVGEVAQALNEHLDDNASTSKKGHVQLTDSVSSTSTTTAATPNSVKQAYDKANAALPKTGGIMTGILTAQSNTSYTVRQVRNIILSTADADVDAMQNGDIWIKYK